MFTKVINSKPGRDTFRQDAMKAEADRRAALLQGEVNGALRRLGVKADSHNRVDTHQLDKVMAAANMSTQQRIMLKAQMAQLSMID
jgi:hypothetical protein